MRLRVEGEWLNGPNVRVTDLDTGRPIRCRSLTVSLDVEGPPAVVMEVYPDELQIDLTLAARVEPDVVTPGPGGDAAVATDSDRKVKAWRQKEPLF